MKINRCWLFFFFQFAFDVNKKSSNHKWEITARLAEKAVIRLQACYQLWRKILESYKCVLQSVLFVGFSFYFVIVFYNCGVLNEIFNNILFFMERCQGKWGRIRIWTIEYKSRKWIIGDTKNRTPLDFFYSRFIWKSLIEIEPKGYRKLKPCINCCSVKYFDRELFFQRNVWQKEHREEVVWGWLFRRCYNKCFDLLNKGLLYRSHQILK